MDEKLSTLPPGTNLSDLSTSKNGNGFLSVLTRNPLAQTAIDAYRSFSERRSSLGLSYPGTVEGISREVSRDVFLSQLMFTGFRAEFTKTLSAAPMFQVAHHVTMGNNSMPPYSFAAIYGSPRFFFHGGLDNDFQLSARAHFRIASGLVAKSSVQLTPNAPDQTMVQLETDYTGSDFNFNVKSINPSLLDDSLTGVFVGQYLQSVTPRLALGLETMWQRSSTEEGPQSAISYVGRYKGDDWIGSAHYLAQGAVQGSYWKRLSDKVEAGVDINLQLLGLSGAGGGPMMGMMKNEGTATVGAKYEFRTAVFRGQVDSNGKVSVCLEKRIAAPVNFTFAGEMDHSKNTAKIGVAVAIESAGADEEEQEQMQRAAEGSSPPPF
ncbi:MAG: translocase of outer mitochondrial membrane [Chrysothrix sp. TS-e1954]|nr:MAG: translocase of outer mitochondrial membrane [Chrysothrix sp. TS-e1954]